MTAFFDTRELCIHFYSIRATWPSYSILFGCISRMILMRSPNNSAPHCAVSSTPLLPDPSWAQIFSSNTLSLFSVTYSFRPHHGPGVDSAPSENEYREHFPGVKAADAWGWQPHHLHVPNVMEIWEPKPPGTLWATPGLSRTTLPLPSTCVSPSV